MKKVYKFRADYCTQCPNLDRELKRISGGIDVEVVNYDTEDGEALGKLFGVRGLPTLVKTEIVQGKEVVCGSLVGFKHSREVFEKFLEV